MKQMYSISRIEYRGRQNRTNLVPAYSYGEGFPVKFEAKRSGSPLFYKTSTIRRSHQSLRSSAEREPRVTDDQLKKTKESLFDQSNRPWPFNSESQGVSRKILNKSNLQILEEENCKHTGKKSIVKKTIVFGDERVKSLASSIPDELSRNIVFQRIIIPKKERNLVLKNNFKTTTEGFLSSNTQTINSLHPLQTAQSEKLITHSWGFNNVEGEGSNKINQREFYEGSGFIHIGHVDYQNYKYQTGEKSFVTDIPAKRMPINVFYNKTETIENAIQSLHVQRLYLQDENSKFQEGNKTNDLLKLPKRSNSLKEFEKSLGMAKLKQLEDYNFKKFEQQKRQTERKLFEKNKNRNIHTSQQNSKEAIGMNPMLSNYPTENDGKISNIKIFDYFRKIHVKDFNFEIDGRYKGVNLSLRKNLLRQEFLYYSEVSRRFFDDLSAILQDRTYGGYSYDDYKVLTSNFKQGIAVKVFIEVYETLKKLKYFVLNRILIAIGANPDNDLDIITWEQFLKFKNVLIYRDAPKEEIIDFVIKLITNDENQNFSKAEFFKTLKTIIYKADETDQIFENLIENFRRTDVIQEDSEMNIVDVLDIIIGNY